MLFLKFKLQSSSLLLWTPITKQCHQARGLILALILITLQYYKNNKVSTLGMKHLGTTAASQLLWKLFFSWASFKYLECLGKTQITSGNYSPHLPELQHSIVVTAINIINLQEAPEDAWRIIWWRLHSHFTSGIKSPYMGVMSLCIKSQSELIWCIHADVKVISYKYATTMQIMEVLIKTEITS